MEEGLTLHTLSSMISGVVYSVCSNPMDVFKTRYVINNDDTIFYKTLKPVILNLFYYC